MDLSLAFSWRTTHKVHPIAPRTQTIRYQSIVFVDRISLDLFHTSHRRASVIVHQPTPSNTQALLPNWPITLIIKCKQSTQFARQMIYLREMRVALSSASLFICFHFLWRAFSRSSIENYGLFYIFGTMHEMFDSAHNLFLDRCEFRMHSASERRFFAFASTVPDGGCRFRWTATKIPDRSAYKHERIDFVGYVLMFECVVCTCCVPCSLNKCHSWLLLKCIDYGYRY